MKYFNYFYELNPSYKMMLSQRKDPDRESKVLYDDLIQTYYKNSLFTDKDDFISIENIKQNFGNDFYTIFLKNKSITYRLSADYLGPSIWWSSQISNLSDEEIIKILMVSRTLGGHIVWSRGFSPTINQARGGANNLYDRFDWTLICVSSYFSLQENSEETFISYLKYISNISGIELDRIELNKSNFSMMFTALKNSSDYLSNFKNFNAFCDFNKLNGNFVDDNYRIKHLCPLLPLRPSKNSYLDYIENNSKAIMERNQQIFT